MKLSTMRRIDYWVGIPACWVVTGIVRVGEWLRRRPSGPDTPRHVLFIELSEMGSTILASAAIQRVRERYPAVAPCFTILEKNAPSLRLLGMFAEDDIFTIRDTSLLTFAIDFVRFMRRARTRRIDTVIDLELFSRVSSLLCLLSGARTRVGFHNYQGEGLYRGEHLTHRVHYNPYHQMSQNFLALIAALDADPREIPAPKQVIPVEPPAVRLGVNPDSFEYVRRELAQRYPIGPSHRLVVINHDAGSLLPIRSWPVERFAELARRLIAHDPSLVVVLMGIAEAQRPAQRITAAVGDPRCIDFVGRTRTLDDVIQLFHQSHLLITNDSGPAHFASLTPIKSITLFGPETPVLYGPLGANAVHLFANLACSPCLSALNHRQSPCTDNKCLQVIGVDEVFAAACRLLEARETAA